MSKKSKVTTDFSDLKRKLKKVSASLQKERVTDQITDTIVDDIRNNATNPKTGRKFKALAKSTVSNRKYLAKYNSTHPNFSPSSPNLTITGKLLDSIKAKISVTSEGLTYKIDVSGRHPKYKGKSGSIGTSQTNRQIRAHLDKKGRDPLGFSPKMKKEIFKFLKDEITKRLK